MSPEAAVLAVTFVAIVAIASINWLLMRAAKLEDDEE
jgi:hypothetical protein